MTSSTPPLARRPWVAQARLDTPLGPVTVAATATGLGGLWFDAQAHHPGPLAAPVDPGHPLLAATAAALARYWGDARQAGFDTLPLDPGGTTFQQAVWCQLCALPAGQTARYGELATALGHPQAARAVGAAVGRNPISLIVPCHRVLGQDGALTGYAGGLARKHWLLHHESLTR
jgi:methylated-DNA-[protein]-cysteine S-methyltransferase